MIEEIDFTDFLSFGSEAEPVQLGPLNVIVGPNGSGKSNLLDGIGLLAACSQKGAIGRVLAAGGGVGAWINHAATSRVATLEAVVRLRDSGPELAVRHRIELAEVGHRHTLDDERISRLPMGPPTGKAKAFPAKARPQLYFSYAAGQPIISRPEAGDRVLSRDAVNSEDSILGQFSDPDQYPELARLGRFYERIRLYREWTFGRGAAYRRPGVTDAPTDQLLPDASNLAMVLNGFKMSTERSITDRLVDLAPGFAGFRTVTQGGTIQLFLTEGDALVPALRLSDGTLRYLALLTILLHPSPPPVVVLEEPELGLHPDLLPGLARLMVEASTRMQIIATRHSDILVDALTDHPTAVLVCDRDAAGTSIRAVDPETVKPWLEEHGLGGAWMHGAIGGKRW